METKSETLTLHPTVDKLQPQLLVVATPSQILVLEVECFYEENLSNRPTKRGCHKAILPSSPNPASLHLTFPDFANIYHPCQDTTIQRVSTHFQEKRVHIKGRFTNG